MISPGSYDFHGGPNQNPGVEPSDVKKLYVKKDGTTETTYDPLSLSDTDLNLTRLAFTRIKNLPDVASESDLVSGNYFAVDTPTVPMRLPAELVATRQNIRDSVIGIISDVVKKTVNSVTGESFSCDVAIGIEKGERVNVAFSDTSNFSGSFFGIYEILQDGTRGTFHASIFPSNEIMTDANCVGLLVTVTASSVAGSGPVEVVITKDTSQKSVIKSTQVEGLGSIWNIRRNNNNGRQKKEFSYPVGFDGRSFFPKIVTDGVNFDVHLDVESLKNTGGRTYYVSPNGSGDGSSESTPTTIRTIVSGGILSDGDTIVMLDGIYRDTMDLRNDSIWTFEYSVNIVAKNKGKVFLCSKGTALSYSEYGDGVYTTTRSNVKRVAQLVHNEVLFLNQVSSVADTSAEGTWYLSGSTLYVHLFGDVVPTNSNTIPLLKYQVSGHPAPVIYTKSENSNVKLYLDGITLLGGTPATIWFTNSSSYTDSILIAKDCKFLGATSESLTYDAVSVLGADAIFVNCDAGYSSKDGFNYHSANGRIPYFIEVNCRGYENGNDGLAEAAGNNSSNGSTSHDGCHGLRVGGTYYRNRGGQVAEVGSGTQTICLGCIAYDSTAPDGNWQNDGFATQAADGASISLYGCKAFGCTYDLYKNVGTTFNYSLTEFESSSGF